MFLIDWTLTVNLTSKVLSKLNLRVTKKTVFTLYDRQGLKYPVHKSVHRRLVFHFSSNSLIKNFYKVREAACSATWRQNKECLIRTLNHKVRIGHDNQVLSVTHVLKVVVFRFWTPQRGVQSQFGTILLKFILKVNQCCSDNYFCFV